MSEKKSKYLREVVGDNQAEDRILDSDPKRKTKKKKVEEGEGVADPSQPKPILG